MRTRIAPTPSGYLHEGNAFNFLLTFRLARASGAKVALRIDDADTTRVRAEYLEDIFRSLEWLDLQPDSGPSGPDDFRAHYSQSLRTELYRSVVVDLTRRGKCYACVCSRKDIQQAAGESHRIYPGTCRPLARAEFDQPFALRAGLDNSARSITWPGMTDAAVQPVDLQEQLGDFVLWRKDSLPAYQLTSLIDDLLLQNHWIIRGEDLRMSTAAQVWLAAVMNPVHVPNDSDIPQMPDVPDLPQGADGLDPATFRKVRFYHHPLITGPDGAKLSKSSGAFALHNWRRDGRKNELLDNFEAWFETLKPHLAGHLRPGETG